ncbi:hypothetical protein AB0L64_39640 [Kribbella sp. NPDC051936]|uniref:hypothetical protein n=1 Tax=Kribbella sp. NPDC051936 TaxID=3154946 RepID=UPI00342423C6
MNGPGSVITQEERRRSLEAVVSAAQFFRGKLLRATEGWPLDYLKESRTEEVLSEDSPWKVGYAPEASTSLVDHLAAQNVAYSTMEAAGLAVRAGDGSVADRFRDQLMFVARDAHLHPTGFIGIASDGEVQTASPPTAIHQASMALTGVEEQIDLLRGGAAPVIVDDPMDAIAMSRMSRHSGGQWAAIPVLGDGLSTAQVRMLRKFSLGDTAIVIASGCEHRQKLTTGYLFDLALYYDRVRAVVLPHSLTAIGAAKSGPQIINHVLTTARPVLTYRVGDVPTTERARDPESPDDGPGL